VTATLDGGEVSCLDSGPIQGGLISKSVTIDCTSMPATVLPILGGPAITVAAAAGVVRLRGLTLSGAGGAIGIAAVNSTWLSVENCLIMNFNVLPGIGILLMSPSELVVSDTFIDNNGTGIRVAPTGDAAVAFRANIELDRVRLGYNGTGMELSGSAASVRAVMRDSVVEFSQLDAIKIGSSELTLQHSSLVHNLWAGIDAVGGALVRIGDSTIAANGSGVQQSFGINTIQSFKENHIGGNGNDGTPIAAFPGPGGASLQ
jgi:hypothetical protein